MGGTGKTYDIQELYAQGKNGNRDLDNGRVGAILYNGQNWVVSSLQTLASIYAQKAIGTVANLDLITAWAPYELLYSSSTNGTVVKINSESVNYNSNQTVCFAYVQDDGQPSTNFMSFVSNMVSVASTQVFGGWYSDGQSYNLGSSKISTIYSPDYADPTSEVNAFISPSYSPTNSYVGDFVFYNPDHSASITQYLIEPGYPAQVF